MTLDTTKFLSWPQSGSVITEILKIPVALVSIHLSYDPEKISSKAVRGWLIIPTLVLHLGQATRAAGTVSAAPHLGHARVPGTVKGGLTAKVFAQRPRLDGNS